MIPLAALLSRAWRLRAWWCCGCFSSEADAPRLLLACVPPQPFPILHTARSSNYSSDEDDLTWVQWYCRQRGNEFLCEVEESYIQDGFNLTGLSSKVPYYEHALDAVLEIESPEGSLMFDGLGVPPHLAHVAHVPACPS